MKVLSTVLHECKVNSCNAQKTGLCWRKIPNAKLLFLGRIWYIGGSKTESFLRLEKIYEELNGKTNTIFPPRHDCSHGHGVYGCAVFGGG